MSGDKKFSERFGFAPAEREITIQNDAPPELRDATLVIASEAGLRPHTLRELICNALRTRPDPQNWSAGNVEAENGQLIHGCEWFEVYDIIERIYATDAAKFFESGSGKGAEYFADEINKFFVKSGIGWQLADGQLQIRDLSPLRSQLTMQKTRLNQVIALLLAMKFIKH